MCGLSVAQVRKKAQICQTHVKRGNEPCERLQIDLIQLPNEAGKEYIFVIIDTFSKCVEAFATSKVHTNTGAKLMNGNNL